MRTLFYNVNEEGLPYMRSTSLNDALLKLQEYPNDHIVITFSGSPQARTLESMLRQDFLQAS